MAYAPCPCEPYDAAEQPEEIPCRYNGGRPCDYTGRGGKGYCEGCCRCPW